MSKWTQKKKYQLIMASSLFISLLGLIFYSALPLEVQTLEAVKAEYDWLAQYSSVTIATLLGIFLYFLGKYSMLED